MIEEEEARRGLAPFGAALALCSCPNRDESASTLGEDDEAYNMGLKEGRAAGVVEESFEERLGGGDAEADRAADDTIDVVS